MCLLSFGCVRAEVEERNTATGGAGEKIMYIYIYMYKYMTINRIRRTKELSRTRVRRQTRNPPAIEVPPKKKWCGEENQKKKEGDDDGSRMRKTLCRKGWG